MGPASPRRCPRSRPHCGFPAVTRRSRSTEHVRQGSLVLVGARRIGGVDEPGHYGCIPAGRSVAFGRTWPSGGRRCADVHATWPAGPSVSRCAKPIWGNVRSLGNRYWESLGKPDSEGASLQREVVSRTYSHHLSPVRAVHSRAVTLAIRRTALGLVEVTLRTPAKPSRSSRAAVNHFRFQANAIAPYISRGDSAEAMFGESHDVLKAPRRHAVVTRIDAKIVRVKCPPAEHLTAALRDGLDVSVPLSEDWSADQILLSRSGLADPVHQARDEHHARRDLRCRVHHAAACEAAIAEWNGPELTWSQVPVRLRSERTLSGVHNVGSVRPHGYRCEARAESAV